MSNKTHSISRVFSTLHQCLHPSVELTAMYQTRSQSWSTKLPSWSVMLMEPQLQRSLGLRTASQSAPVVHTESCPMGEHFRYLCSDRLK